MVIWILYTVTEWARLFSSVPEPDVLSAPMLGYIAALVAAALLGGRQYLIHPIEGSPLGPRAECAQNGAGLHHDDGDSRCSLWADMAHGVFTVRNPLAGAQWLYRIDRWRYAAFRSAKKHRAEAHIALRDAVATSDRPRRMACAR